jgi:hypothetical protein
MRREQKNTGFAKEESRKWCGRGCGGGLGVGAAWGYTVVPMGPRISARTLSTFMPWVLATGETREMALRMGGGGGGVGKGRGGWE